MNRYDKKNRLQELNQEIKDQMKRLVIEKKKLEVLEKTYEVEHISELPILMFIVDETLPMPEDEYDRNYELVYYLPDFDEIKFTYLNCRYDKPNKRLPNTLDLTEKFETYGMPKHIFPGSIRPEYYIKVSDAVSNLIQEIDTIFLTKEITSWEEVGNYLKHSEKIKTLTENN